ncbi:hypothetical protein [Bradyrhizobium sp.]|uniref:hypothetical protein n=1 Tax=Bradyrhizobium sp. TaxID=376 RepID=UPI003C5477CE
MIAAGKSRCDARRLRNNFDDRGSANAFSAAGFSSGMSRAFPFGKVCGQSGFEVKPTHLCHSGSVSVSPARLKIILF